MTRLSGAVWSLPLMYLPVLAKKLDKVAVNKITTCSVVVTHLWISFELITLFHLSLKVFHCWQHLCSKFVLDKISFLLCFALSLHLTQSKHLLLYSTNSSDFKAVINEEKKQN